MTSKQLDSFSVFPTTDGKTIVVNHQSSDYELDANENKLIVRTPDHWALGKTTIHGSTIEGGTSIETIVDTDPFTIITSGHSGYDLDGYDGVLVSADGYSIVRGVIRDAETQDFRLYGAASLSTGSYYYMFGGADTDGELTNNVWLSYNTINWFYIGNGPWHPRENAIAITDGTYVWIAGGTTISDYLDVAPDIWRGTIEDSGYITWDDGYIDYNVESLEGISEGTYSDYDSGNYLITANVVYDLDTATEYNPASDTDGYGSVIHYDKDLDYYWNSKSGYRTEYVQTGTGTLQEVGQFGYLHDQTTDSDKWEINHGLNDTQVGCVIYDDDNILMLPKNITWVDANNIQVDWNSSVSGKAIVSPSDYYSSDTWVMPDGYTGSNSCYYLQDTTGNFLEPVTYTLTDPLTFGFRASVDGYAMLWKNYVSANTLGGRRYIYSGDFDDSVLLTLYQEGDGHFYTHRASDGEFIVPSTISYALNQTNFTMISPSYSGAKFASLDMRHDGYRDLQDPFNGNYMSLAVNTNNNRAVFVAGDDGVWYSSDAGITFSRSDAVGVEIPDTRKTPVVCNAGMVTLMNEYDTLSRSLDFGDNFSTSTGIGKDTIIWYGPLITDIDTNYRFFTYPRPADVVWESKYGHLPGEFVDRNETQYVLAYPHVTDGSVDAVEITLDSDFSLDIKLDELKDYYLIIYNLADGTVADWVKIFRNSRAESGDLLTIYPVRDLVVTPGVNYLGQVIHTHTEGAKYYTALTRNLVYDYNVYYEADGSTFILDDERAYDFYGNLLINGGLPDYAKSDSNTARLNNVLAELNRQRVAVGQSYNDSDTLPPEPLYRLAEQYGIRNVRDLDILPVRRLVKQHFSQVGLYGGCITGIQNLIDLAFGSGNGVVVSVDEASGVAGLGVKIGISSYADFSWAYNASHNIVKYNATTGYYYMIADASQINADFATVVNRRFYHINSTVIDSPLIIKNFSASAVTAKLDVSVSDRDITQWALDTDSIMFIADEVKSLRIEWVINEIKRIIPFYVNIKFE